MKSIKMMIESADIINFSLLGIKRVLKLLNSMSEVHNNPVYKIFRYFSLIKNKKVVKSHHLPSTIIKCIVTSLLLKYSIYMK